MFQRHTGPNQYRVTIRPVGSWPAFEATVSASTQYRAELQAIEQYRAYYAGFGCQPPSIETYETEQRD